MTGRGITKVADVRARCEVDLTTMCWNWTGAFGSGAPRMHTFDHDRGEKRVISGPKAVWNIAFGESPPAWALVFRRCCNQRCLNPVHLGLARSRAEIGEHIRLAGSRKGTSMEARRLNGAKGRIAMGQVDTPVEAVRAIRAAPVEVRSRELARQLGMLESTVGRIRRGETHKGVSE